jgi:hypothetical protein
LVDEEEGCGYTHGLQEPGGTRCSQDCDDSCERLENWIMDNISSLPNQTEEELGGELQVYNQ